MLQFSHTLGHIPPAPDVFSDIEKFLCVMYGKANLNKVDDVRYAYFQQNYAPKRNDDPLEKIKGMNPSSMPPSQYVFTTRSFEQIMCHTYGGKHILRIPRISAQKDKDGILGMVNIKLTGMTVIRCLIVSVRYLEWNILPLTWKVMNLKMKIFSRTNQDQIQMMLIQMVNGNNFKLFKNSYMSHIYSVYSVFQLLRLSSF